MIHSFATARQSGRAPAGLGKTQLAIETTAVTVLLTNGQIAMLDEIALAIRRKSGTVPQPIRDDRAFITAALPHRDWWVHATSEKALQETVSLRMVITMRQQEDVNNQAARRTA